MIIMKLKGGMCNQLFQYAIGRYLSIKHNTELKLDIKFYETYDLHKYSLSPFNIIERFAKQEEVEKLPSYKERNLSFHPEALNLTNNIYLDGYWQCEKYFINIENIIRKEFTIKQSLEGSNKDLSDWITSCNSVSLHIRRGSYLLPQHFSFHGLCPIEYYTKCVEYINNTIDNPCFFVFSDDPYWSMENIKIAQTTTYISHNKIDKDYEDLRLMSLCKHNIIANSTFSWWGAWLNDNPSKIILSPQNWFVDKSINTNDLIPPSWARL